jgi:hypothetical protein
MTNNPGRTLNRHSIYLARPVISLTKTVWQEVCHVNSMSNLEWADSFYTSPLGRLTLRRKNILIPPFHDKPKSQREALEEEAHVDQERARNIGYQRWK